MNPGRGGLTDVVEDHEVSVGVEGASETDSSALAAGELNAAAAHVCVVAGGQRLEVRSQLRPLYRLRVPR